MFFLVFLTTFGPHHFWPAPLLARTTFGPDRLLAHRTFFDQTVLCPNLCEPSLTPKNLGQWGCSSGQFVAHVLFFGPWTSLRGTSLAQDHPVRICCCVVWCVVVVVLCCGVSVECVFKIFVGASKIWALLPDSPSAGHPSAGPPSAGPPKISLFFPSPATIFILSSSLGGRFVEFWWCLKRRDPQMCTFGLSGCRVNPGGFCKMSRTITQLISSPLTSENDKNNFLYPKKHIPIFFETEEEGHSVTTKLNPQGHDTWSGESTGCSSFPDAARSLSRLRCARHVSNATTTSLQRVDDASSGQVASLSLHASRRIAPSTSAA